MNRFFSFIFDVRVLAVLGFFALTIFMLMLAVTLDIPIIWVIIGLTVIATLWLFLLLWRKWKAQRESSAISRTLESEAQRAVQNAPADKRVEVEALRDRMSAALKTIKTSKLGELSGNAALYELPWYLVIGNPAAGKSSAIAHSGLNFPFSDVNGNIIHGLGGTRNCDWFFTSEGILVDTAGRYSVYEADREEWLSFLQLLKKHRPKAPVNGIIIAVSISELTQSKPEYGINIAKQLRLRVQELSSELGVFAPVYVMFTKADLIVGFSEFFEDADADERGGVWGATLPYDAEGKTDAAQAFDNHFSQLVEGLHELSVKRMAMSLNGNISAGVLSFPIEFASLRSSLKTFIATLFEENPFQYKPIFRGFYFSSAVREGTPVSTSDARMTEQFSLKPSAISRPPVAIYEGAGFFLSGLFSKVIFADKNLVKQFTSRAQMRTRAIGFALIVLFLTGTLSAWSWSYFANQKFIANIRTDLDKVATIQQTKTDLASRLESLEILQDRLQQLQTYRRSKPAALGFGLYQGNTIERNLRAQYFKGVRDVLLDPVTGSVETFLNDVNNNADKLATVHAIQATPAVAATGGPKPYREASPSNVEDAYNALKTYLMLSSHDHLESGHLNDQITRFWRVWLENNRGSMPREQMIRSAEHILTFYLSQVNQPDFPTIENKVALVDQVRNNLRHVVHGMPARERVYSEIKARASTRFPPLTVASIVGPENSKIVTGGYSISGAFSRDAWEKYVAPAIKDAATHELESTDWVLQTKTQEDLTLQGSPEQIQKALVDMYKTEYIAEWKKFLQGVSISGFNDFGGAVAGLNRLGDPDSSPIKRLMTSVYQQTSWDNPSLAKHVLTQDQDGFFEKFKRKILGQQLPNANLVLNVDSASVGLVGKEFTTISALMMPRGDSNVVLLDGYLSNLAKLRSRFNQMQNSGDPGPAARQVMQATFDGTSELTETLKFVDESMLIGMTDSQRATIRPLLVRPLMEAFTVIVAPAQTELNKIWQAQVYTPFNATLAAKYPFQEHSGVEAGAGEINQIFGPDGAIAKFTTSSLASLVVQRGQTFVPRTWADIGIKLNPEFAVNYPRYVAPPNGPVAGSGASQAAQTVFQILPNPSQGLTEYTIVIDGQTLTYHNEVASWARFQWPGSGTPGSRITAKTYDGRTVEILNIPGNFGLEKMIDAAKKQKRQNGDFDLSWTDGTNTVSVVLRVIQRTGADRDAPTAKPDLKGLKLPAIIAGDTDGQKQPVAVSMTR